jgi:hypothetical protein
MAGRRTFRILTYSQLSGIKVVVVSGYVIAVFGCNVAYVKCNIETDYIAFQAKAGDVTRYHADGKQPVSRVAVFF